MNNQKQNSFGGKSADAAPGVANLRAATFGCSQQSLETARIALLKRGVYPQAVFIKQVNEAATVGTQLAELESVAFAFKEVVPEINIITESATRAILSSGPELIAENSRHKITATEEAMVKCSFLTEMLGVHMLEACKLIANSNSFIVESDAEDAMRKNLAELFDREAGKSLVQFCAAKTKSYGLLSETFKTVVLPQLADRLATGVSFEQLNQLCESVPVMKLYVSDDTFNTMAAGLAT